MIGVVAPRPPAASRRSPYDARPRLRAGLAVTLCLALLLWSGVTVTRSTRGESLSVLCSSIEDLCRQWATGFSERTGIPVSMVRLPSREVLARLGRGAGLDADVWHGGPAELYVLAHEQGRLDPHIPADAAAVPASDRDPRGAWTGVYRGNLGFCSDPEALRSLGLGIPRSWEDLLDPRLAGHISMPNPVTSGTGTTIVGVQVSRLGSPDDALAWLRRLDRNVLQYTRSGMAPAGVAARGEVAVALTFTQHCVRQIAAGRHLTVSYPSEGTGAEVGAVARLRSARHPLWAAAYVDFAVSRQGQDIGREERVPQLPTRTDLDADPRLVLDPGIRQLSTSTTDARATESAVSRFAAQVRP